MSITDPLIGSKLGDYVIRDILGRGGMARVYRGYDANLARYAAVKVIDAHLSSETEEEYRQRFQREARAIARLNHPNIVSVFQFGQVDTIYYMAMAFIEGRDLGQILRELASQGKLLPHQQILSIMRDIAHALDHAHAHGVIHRDVKPSNIMLTPTGSAVLTDFGLALDVPEGSIGNTFGSAHYIAPEQAVSSANAKPQSDLYSLGVVLYQMIVGKVPFDDPSAMSVALKHLSDPPPPPRLFNPNISPDVEAVILKALQKEPADRFPNGESLIAALEAALAVDEDAKPTASSPKRATGESRASGGSGLDSKGLRPTNTKPLPKIATDAPTRRPNPLISGGVIAVVLGLLAIGAALLIPGLSGSSPTPTTPSTAVAALVDETAEVTGTERVAQNATGTAARTPAAAATEAITADVSETESETEAATQPANTATVSTSRTPRATAEPAASEAVPTVRPTRVTAAIIDAPTNIGSGADATVDADSATVTPTPTETAAAATREVLITPQGVLDIELIYDENVLVLINRTTETLDVRGLRFEQAQANGGSRVLNAREWPDADRLAPNNCMEVWTIIFREPDPSDYCTGGERQSWLSKSEPRWFWIRETNETDFTVTLNGTMLTTCPIDAGRCMFDLPEQTTED